MSWLKFAADSKTLWAIQMTDSGPEFSVDTNLGTYESEEQANAVLQELQAMIKQSGRRLPRGSGEPMESSHLGVFQIEIPGSRTAAELFQILNR